MVHYRSAVTGGHRVFYREAGKPEDPAVLLLHGFPTSSHMFRDLIPLLADRYHIVAPDLPGFGNTVSPPRGQFNYTFDNLARVIGGFVETIGLSRYAVYVFDYGAPTGFRLAVSHPDRITAIISQNGNAYEEGLSDGWNPIRAYWQDSSQANRDALRTFLKPETTVWQYTHGVFDPTRVSLFLNVGTRATIPSVPGLADAQPLTHIEALELDRLPAHLVVLGGGYVGLEMAQAYRRFGSRVTVLEHGPRLVSREDPDVGDALGQLFKDDGIEVHLSTEVLHVEGRSGASVRLRVRTPQGERHIEGSDILAATGRTPNTSGIGLETVGVRLDARGYIQVNERLETSVPGVWAIGECAGSPQFTHVSEDDFRIIRDNLAGGKRTTRDRLIPFCLFTDPPVARVGLSEAEARQQGVAMRVARLPMAAVLRAQTTGETRGFMKALIDGRTDRILGFTMFGPEAGEVMAVVQTAMLAGAPYTSLRDAVLAHPTMAEGLGPLFAEVRPS
jgi:pyruvate/2-oxoglutarate dehydrogenase complex dihydrolipoamide dehydrogenase (E3) component